MTSKEARDKSEDFKLNSGKNDLKGVLGKINESAEKGWVSCEWDLPNRGELSDQILNKLKELGYTVQHHGCLQGITKYMIYW